jgi:hypothetical protein
MGAVQAGCAFTLGGSLPSGATPQHWR